MMVSVRGKEVGVDHEDWIAEKNSDGLLVEGLQEPIAQLGWK